MNDKLKGYLKKIVIIVGFIYVLYCFVSLLHIFFHVPVQIFCIFMIVFNLTIQFIHYNNTKIKNIGKRIVISFGVVTVSTIVFNMGYCRFKTYMGNELLDSISVMKFNGYRFDKNDLENTKIRFVSDNITLHKGSYDLIIYYEDGSVEKSVAFSNGVDLYILDIEGDKYYFDTSEF